MCSSSKSKSTSTNLYWTSLGNSIVKVKKLKGELNTPKLASARSLLFRFSFSKRTRKPSRNRNTLKTPRPERELCNCLFKRASSTPLKTAARQDQMHIPSIGMYNPSACSIQVERRYRRRNSRNEDRLVVHRFWKRTAPYSSMQSPTASIMGS